MSGQPATDRSSPSAAIGYQRWRDLLFVHWRLPPMVVAGLLPAGIVPDTWEGSAWIGLVAFSMQGVRPWWSPPIPYLSAFPETNVRTYVRNAETGEQGVYFFSLDAARLPAVLIARGRWNLSYHWSRMRVARTSQRVKYLSQRFLAAAARCRLEAELGEPLPAVANDSIEHFLVERYVFFNHSKRGWQRGVVRHAPYPLRAAQLLACDQSLTTAAGIEIVGPPDHVVFSPGVDVSVESLQPVSGRDQSLAGGNVTTVNQN